MIQKFWQNEFARGSLLLTGANIIVSLFNYLFNIFIARSLGPSGLAEISALFSYMILASVPLGVLTTIMVQKIGSKGERKFEFMQTAEKLFLFILKKTTPAVILLILISPFTVNITNLSLISSILFIPFITITFISAFYSSIIYGLKFFYFLAVVSIVGAFIKLFGAILVLFGVDGISLVLLFLLLSSLIIACAYILKIRRIKTNPSSVSEYYLKHTIQTILMRKQFLITTASVFALTAFTTIDIIYAKKFFFPEEAGMYSAWALFAKVILYVFGPVISVALVYFSEKNTMQKQKFIFFLPTVFILAAGICAYLIYDMFGGMFIVAFLGKTFLPISRYLSYAAIFGISYFFISLANTYFLAKKSAYSLILFFLLTPYLIALFFIPKEFMYLIYLNSVFSGIAAIFYFIAWIKTLVYNKAR